MSALVGQESIPRIIHQIWIGPKPAPTKFMDTWKDKHPDFEYIRWTENEMKKRGFVSNCQNRIDEMEELCGKADIIRWEILYKFVNKHGPVVIHARNPVFVTLTQLSCIHSIAALTSGCLGGNAIVPTAIKPLRTSSCSHPAKHLVFVKTSSIGSIHIESASTNSPP